MTDERVHELDRRLIALERDTEYMRGELTEIAKSMASMQRLLIGILVSITTGTVMLAIKLVIDMAAR